ncbi:uncharacterized protein LOC131687835 [Topomyia yanbarensis]|uniref:uncharacterized protein LOC131687835 n=1 Tax=Topomyia yanbarensis TaxID=2498891 RepID=UPI00273AE51C|nr:uncharacterized protein LOC131687835 [Topomyia yanbarensis]
MIAEPILETHNFSQWNPLLRRMAYVVRTADNFKKNALRKPCVRGPLRQNELIRAEMFLYRTAQSSAYAEEIGILKINQADSRLLLQIPRNSAIISFNPYLDENDVLRARGRTKLCKFISSTAAQPVILPHHHHITKLIIADVHKKYHHQNHRTIINEINQQYCISRLKSTYNSIRNNCQHCKNERAAPQPPAMSFLPMARLAAYSPPFTHMGVDYFGPMLVLVGRRIEKRWGVLATCLTTRAVHLEIAHTLTTSSCIMAIRNIMARRGVPAVIYSDRGSNFQGTSKELQTAMEELDEECLAKEFTTIHTDWKFIPPASPHMGGAWERLIRSVKQNLIKLSPNKVPTDEVLRNTLIEIENIINSRPLTDVPVDNDQSPVLTPNHFLLGSSNGRRSWVPYDDTYITLKNNWQLSQVLANAFWKLWLQDYLPTLTRRTKWFNEVKPIQVNDIVVIIDPKLARNCWPKGRIIATIPSADGQVR